MRYPVTTNRVFRSAGRVGTVSDSDRPRDEGGQYASEVTPEDVLGVFDAVEGPAITSSDVVAALDCSREVARRRLGDLHDRGEVERRQAGRTVLWWRSERTDGYERAIGALAGSGIGDEVREVRERHRDEWDDRDDPLSGQ